MTDRVYRCEVCGHGSTDREHFRRTIDLQEGAHLACADHAACRERRARRRASHGCPYCGQPFDPLLPR